MVEIQRFSLGKCIAATPDRFWILSMPLAGALCIGTCDDEDQGIFRVVIRPRVSVLNNPK